MGRLLEQVLAMDNLREAWNAVADNRGMAGVDHISTRRWQRNWEERLVALARAVRSNHYRPQPLRVRRIPKRQHHEYRTLRIPTVTDRVLERAVLQVLYELYEPYFLACSYAYRPGRSLKDAVQAILTFREAGYTWVLDADIHAFFDSVDQTRLLTQLAERVPDAALLRLIERWLLRARARAERPLGLPMGGPLSPLLANVYLHPLDVALRNAGRKAVRYADDFIILTQSEAEVAGVYREAEALLAALRLRYEPSKTGVSTFREGFVFLGVTFRGHTYTYPWEGKRIKVQGARVDRLFDTYGPRYG